MINIKTIPVLSIVVIGLSSCAGLNKADPYEKYNRQVFNFNNGFYKHIGTPIINGYETVSTENMRSGISNFFDNTEEPVRMLNDLLQGHPIWFLEDTSRFVLNTVFGFFGFIDAAEYAGLHKRFQGFDMTLASWGWRDSSYIVLPFLGPTTIRGSIGYGADYVANPLVISSFVWPDILSTEVFMPVNAVYYANKGSEILPQYNSLTKYSIDPYIAIRNAYLQYLDNQIDTIYYNDSESVSDTYDNDSEYPFDDEYQFSDDYENDEPSTENQKVVSKNESTVINKKTINIKDDFSEEETYAGTSINSNKPS